MQMKFSISSSKSGRTRSSQAYTWFPEASTHPDLPLNPAAQPSSGTTNSSPRPNTFNRSASLHDRGASLGQILSHDRRSVAVNTVPTRPITAHSSEDFSPNTSHPGIARAQTVLRKESGGIRSHFADEYSPAHEFNPHLPSPTTHWAGDQTTYSSRSTPPLPVPGPSTLSEHREIDDDGAAAGMPQSASSQYSGNVPGKISIDSGQQHSVLDRFTARRLQRLNTEQEYRVQRQTGAASNALLSPIEATTPYISSQHNTISNLPQYASSDAQPHSSLHNPAQPHPSQQVAYQASRTGQANQPPLAIQNQTSASSTTNTSRSPNYSSSAHDAVNVPLPPHHHHHHQPAHQYSPQDSTSNSTPSDSGRPSLAQSRSYTSPADDPSMSGNGSLSAPKAQRSNRQSVHTAMGNGAGINPSSNQTQSHKNGQPPQSQQSDVARPTPQPSQPEDMTDEDVAQLIRDHKELREKYTKVKKYYFEREDQVKQLQNSLAHQRLSQSRTSLDDSEYATRFNRLDGLVAQLAFSIRKEWKTLPTWLLSSINKDAIQIGKQEMTAAGRAFISNWLVREFFEKCFHPDLDPALSLQLRTVQTNIRRYAAATQTQEEEEYLTSKIVNWRLATLEGLQDALRSSQCPTNRLQLTNTIKDQLVAAISHHMGGEAPADLEGGVHMIVELVVSIAIHLPLESRDVDIEYFDPGLPILADQMKTETGCPPLLTSFTDDAAERASMKSAASDAADLADGAASADPSKKRSMLSAITGSNNKSRSSAQGKHAAAAGSSSSLNRPESSHGAKEDIAPRVRMAAGICVTVRGRSVLVKAPVFTM